MRLALLILSVCVLPGTTAHAQKKPSVTITPDVVYGHKDGLAMTMDVFRPAEEHVNGAGVLFMVSGGWFSRWSPPEGQRGLFAPLTDRGFTVFAVRHGSSPRFSIPEAVSDVRRSVRYIRLHAKKLGVDPNRLGVYGFSAGGHLSLMLGTASDDGNPNASDPVLRVSDKVQAVVACVAPTDLQIMVRGAADRLPAYDRFPALDLKLPAARKHSPLVHVTADDAPTLLIAGDQDKLVPIQHSRNIHEAFTKAGVKCEFMVLAGAGHGFQGKDYTNAQAALVKWFETHLATGDK